MCIAPPEIGPTAVIPPLDNDDRRCGEAIAVAGDLIAVASPTDGDDALAPGFVRVFRIAARHAAAFGAGRIDSGSRGSDSGDPSSGDLSSGDLSSGDLSSGELGSRDSGLGDQYLREIGRFRARAEGDHFGAAVAIDAGFDRRSPWARLAIGIDRAHAESTSAGAPLVEFAGAVEIYLQRDGPADGPHWRLEQALRSPDAQAGAEFGAAIAMTRPIPPLATSESALAVGAVAPAARLPHAQLLVVASPRHDVAWPGPSADRALLHDAGRIDIYLAEPGPREASGNDQGLAWRHEASATAPTPSTSAWFGRAIATDGRWIAVGAPGERDDRGTRSTHDDVASAGAVHLYERIDGGVVHAATIRSPEPAHAAWFGWSVAIDGGRLAVGCPRARRAGAAVGAVLLYDLARPTSVERIVHAPDPQAGAAFGQAICMRGGLLLVGAPGTDAVVASERSLDAIEDLGAVWALDGEGVVRLMPPVLERSALFGSACAIMCPLQSAWPAPRDGWAAACAGRYTEEESVGPSPGLAVYRGWR